MTALDDWGKCRNCDRIHEHPCAICGGGHGPLTETFQAQPGVWLCWGCHNFYQGRPLAVMLWERAKTEVLMNHWLITEKDSFRARLKAEDAVAHARSSMVAEERVFGAIPERLREIVVAKVERVYREVWHEGGEAGDAVVSQPGAQPTGVKRVRGQAPVSDSRGGAGTRAAAPRVRASRAGAVPVRPVRQLPPRASKEAPLRRRQECAYCGTEFEYLYDAVGPPFRYCEAHRDAAHRHRVYRRNRGEWR